MNLKILKQLYELNYRALTLNLEDVNDEEALILPRLGGNCLNWIVGHILISRDEILRQLGEKSVFPGDEANAYKRGSNTENIHVLTPLNRLLEKMAETQKILEDALGHLTETETEAEWIDQLSFLQFHETYHVGQTGLLRRIIGKEGAIK